MFIGRLLRGRMFNGRLHREWKFTTGRMTTTVLRPGIWIHIWRRLKIWILGNTRHCKITNQIPTPFPLAPFLFASFHGCCGVRIYTFIAKTMKLWAAEEKTRKYHYPVWSKNFPEWPSMSARKEVPHRTHRMPSRIGSPWRLWATAQSVNPTLAGRSLWTAEIWSWARKSPLNVDQILINRPLGSWST